MKNEFESNDSKNIKRRKNRKARHNERANKERENMIKQYDEHITIISWLPLDKKKLHDEYLVKFKLDTPIKPDDFLDLLIKEIGEFLNV